MPHSPAWAVSCLVTISLATSMSLASNAFAQNTHIVNGRITSRNDSSGIFAAVVRSSTGRVLARADQSGKFSARATVGDTLIIRALGFKEQRVAVIGDVVNASLQVSPTVLSTYTTTVGQRTIRAGEATTRTTVLDRSDIDGAAAISASQLLRQVPGLQEFAAQPAATSIAIRGFDAARVLVLIDGEPAAGSLIENRDIGRLSTVAAERIEVTKGPSSVEFGSDALGGVINLVTAAPTKDFSADALFRDGQLGRKESTAGVSQTVGDFGYRMNGGWRQVDRVTAINSDVSTLERVYDFRSSFRYNVGDKLFLRADAQGSNERQRWPVGAGYNGFIDNNTGQGFLEVQTNALGGSLRGRAFAQRYNYKYRQSQLLIPIAGGDSLEQQERLERYLLAYARAFGAHTFDVGTQFSVRTLISPGKVDGDSAHDNVNEVFARDSWTVGAVLANVGARYSSSSLWGSAFNPSFGMAVQAAPRWRLRANVARGFRAPSFKEIRYTFANPGAGYTVVGNPDLKPESSWSNSLGVTWAPGSQFSIDIEGYRNNVSSLIDTRYAGTNAAGFIVYKSVNIAKAYTEGVESNAAWRRDRWDMSLGYDFLHTRDDESKLPLSGRAANTVRAHVARDWRVLHSLTTDLTARYTGASDLIGAVGDSLEVVGQQGSFLSVDAQIRLSLTRSAELSGGVNNLLGQLPKLYSPAYQRQVFAAVHIKWFGDR